MSEEFPNKWDLIFTLALIFVAAVICGAVVGFYYA